MRSEYQILKPVPNFKKDKDPLSIEIVIFDYTGNVVIRAHDNNVLRNSIINPLAGTYQLHCYWDCRTQRGLPVAKGVYKAALFWKMGSKGGKCSTVIGVR